MGGVHVDLHVIVLDTIAAYGYVSVTMYVLALSSDSGFPGFGCTGVVFLFIEFHFINKILCHLNFAFTIFVTHCAHTRGKLEVNLFFQLLALSCCMEGFEAQRAAAHNASLSAYERLTCKVFERTFIWNIVGHVQIVESLEFPDAKYYGTLQAHFIQHR